MLKIIEEITVKKYSEHFTGSREQLQALWKEVIISEEAKGNQRPFISAEVSGKNFDLFPWYGKTFSQMTEDRVVGIYNTEKEFISVSKTRTQCEKPMTIFEALCTTRNIALNFDKISGQIIIFFGEEGINDEYINQGYVVIQRVEGVLNIIVFSYVENMHWLGTNFFLCY